jgi:hypothetical protein
VSQPKVPTRHERSDFLTPARINICLMSQNDHKGNPALGMSTVLERGRARKETSHHVRLFDMARGDSSAVFVSRIKIRKEPTGRY